MLIKNKSIFASQIRERGLKISPSNILDFEFEKFEEKKYFFYADIQSKSNVYEVSVSIDFKSGRVKPEYCTCPYQFYCKHQYALTLYAEKKEIIEMNNSQAPQNNDNSIIGKLNKKILENLVQKSEEYKYKIVPQYKISENNFIEINLKVEILNEKTFIIKDVYELIHFFTTEEKIKYGKNSEIEYKLNLFSNHKYIEKLLDIAKKINETLSKNYIKNWYNIMYESSKIIVNPDQFIELLKIEEEFIMFNFRENFFRKYDILKEKNQRKLKIEILKQKDNYIETLNNEILDNKTLESSNNNDLGYVIKLKKNSKKVITENLLFTTNGVIIFSTDSKNVKNTIKIISFDSNYTMDIIKELHIKDIEIKPTELYEFSNLVLKKIENDLDVYSEIEKKEFIQKSIDIEIIAENEIVYITKTIDEKKTDNVENENYSIENNFLIEKELEQYKTALNYTDNEILSNTFNDFQIIEEDVEKKDIQKYEIHGTEKIFNFIDNKLEKIHTLSDNVKVNSKFQKMKILEDFQITANLKTKSKGLELSLLSKEFDTEELKKIIKEYEKKELKYYLLNSGNYIDLNNEKFEELENLMLGLNISLNEFQKNEVLISKHRSLYLDKLLEKSNVEFKKDAKLTKLLEDFENYKDIQFKVPKKINANLREYQVEGYNWLRFLQKYEFNGILADDMGLGKTLQVITLISAFKKDLNIVIAPSSLLINWQKEIEKFNPELKVLLVNGNKKEREKTSDSFTGYHLIITSYDILKREIAMFDKYEYNYVILDEAQHIKNSKTQSSKAVKILTAQHKLALTGTPMENSISELWSIFDFLMPGYLLNRTQFIKKFEKPIIKENDKIKLNELKQMTAPFILRRLKKDVLKDLPDKVEQIIHVELAEKQRKIYDMTLLKLQEKISNKDEKEINSSKIEILSYLTKLRQICCNPRLVMPTYPNVSAKLAAVEELIMELKENSQKTIIFSQFVSNFEYIKKRFNKLGVSYVELTGKTDKNIRHSLVEEFNKDKTDVFLISLKAGGTGLNIVGANTVIHFDPWWNSSAENQATDRAHRIGQKNTVNVYKIIAQNTIESKILEIQKDKSKLADAILENNQADFKKMTKEDIMNLFIT